LRLCESDESANVAKNDVTAGGDGVNVHIKKNSTSLWSRSLANEDSIGYEVNLVITVTANDAIYFIVIRSGSTYFDGTNWLPVITYIEL
jgi:hypothetical protein